MDSLNRKRRQGGMAYIETLFALPVAVLMLLGMADFSFAFQDFLAANHAAEVGARTASLSLGGDCDPNTIREDAQGAVAAAMVRAGVVDATAESQYANTVLVEREDGGSDLCAAGLLAVKVPFDLDLAMLRGFVDPFSSVDIFTPSAHLVQAVSQNENRN